MSQRVMGVDLGERVTCLAATAWRRPGGGAAVGAVFVDIDARAVVGVVRKADLGVEFGADGPSAVPDGRWGAMGPADRRRCVEFVDALAEVAWVAGELGHHPGEAAARVQGQLGAGPVQPGVGSVLAQMRTAGFEPGRPYAVMSMTPQSAPDAPGAPATGAAQPPPARPDRAEGAGV